MTQASNQTAAGSGAGIEIVRMPAELDLTTSEDAAALGCAAIARLARLVLLDLAGVSFCDARGLSALVKIANQADAAS
jgi:anti-sigma B factor antagonist